MSDKTLNKGQEIEFAKQKKKELLQSLYNQYENSDKLYVEIVEVNGLEFALKAMRNPKKSWHLNDSTNEFLGENDKRLSQILCKGGSEERKHLRMVTVNMNVNMPRYWWSEFDTYKFNTKISESTMHKLFDKKQELTFDNFYYHKDDELDVFKDIQRFNMLREKYLKEEKSYIKDDILKRAKTRLNDGYLQMRSISINMEELLNIYMQRRYHRLSYEWGQVFCKSVENIPYFLELTGVKPIFD